MSRKLFTTAEAAEKLNLPLRIIQRVCQKHRIGQRIGRIIVLSSADIRSIPKKRGNPGNPLFVEGNDLWKGSRKSEKTT